MKNPKKPKAKPLFDNAVHKTECMRCFSNDLGTYTPPYYGEYVRSVWLDGALKKFTIPADKETRAAKAKAKWHEVNTILQLQYTESIIVRTRGAETQPLLWGVGLSVEIRSHLVRARELIRTVLGDEVDVDEASVYCRHSGGTTIGVPFTDTSVERKWTFPLSITAGALPYAQHVLERDPLLAWSILDHNGAGFLPGAEDLSDPELGHAMAQDVLSHSLVVAGSRSTTVPKSDEIDRFIAVEPTWNMYLQQGVARLMHDKMARFGLDLQSDPEKHRRFAFRGSVSNHLATIDFESMSDRVSLVACALLLPPQWLALLMDLRSPSIEVDGVWTECYMISSMGNATTFPLETLILWAIAATCNTACQPGRKVLRQRAQSDLGVFGDDVIIPSRDVDSFLATTQSLGFVVNQKKTFFGDEFFRESCGGDFYHGRDVRPLHFKAFPEPKSRIFCEAHLYNTINLVIRKYIVYFGKDVYLYDRALLRYLFDCLNRVTKKIKFVPRDFPTDSGICFLEDAARLISCYKLNPSRVAVNQHGQFQFRYLRFVNNESKRSDSIRYAMDLARGAMLTGKTTSALDYLKSASPPAGRVDREFGTYVEMYNIRTPVWKRAGSSSTYI